MQQKNPGKFEVPNWDQASQKKVRDPLLVLGATLPDSKRMFGTKDEVDPVRHLIGCAMAWGGKTPNWLPIVSGWNYIVRLYRPRKEIIDGAWKFSAAQPVP